MGPGYVVAAILELAGLSGLVIAAYVGRTERQARAAELLGFLRSGQIPSATAETTVGRRRGESRPRAIDATMILYSRDAEPLRASAARSALGRAIARSSRQPSPALTASLSAG